MSFFKNMFSRKDNITITDPASFWSWFADHQTAFFRTLKTQKQVDKDFFKRLMPALQSLNVDFYCLAGMEDPDTAELIITADNNIKTFAFVEDLVATAPVMPGWKFTALKPPTSMKHSYTHMQGFDFNDSNIRFFYVEHAEYPDLIDIALVHAELRPENREIMISGTLIYLANALGELNVSTLIDSIQVLGPAEANGRELIDLNKLPDFLVWKEKEFVERYDDLVQNTDENNYILLEASDENDLPMIAVINKDLLQWDAKPSHPWIMIIEIKYEGSGNKGMPDDSTYSMCSAFENELVERLPDAAGYLALARETYNSYRTLYFACKEFRNSSRETASLIRKYQDSLDISYDIFKDKYWQVMDRFNS